MTDKCDDCGSFRHVLEEEAVGFCVRRKRVVAKIECCEDFDERSEPVSLDEFGKSMKFSSAGSEGDVPYGKWGDEVRNRYD